MRACVPCLALLLAASGAAAEEVAVPAAPPPLDARVAAALDAAGLKYGADEGDFRLVLNVADGRSQVVWVASATTKLSQLEIRDVWALGARGEGQVPPEVARRLLTENARMVVGAWQVNQAPDRYLVVYLAQLPAASDAAALRVVVEAVAVSADRMERELSAGDEF